MINSPEMFIKGYDTNSPIGGHLISFFNKLLLRNEEYESNSSLYEISKNLLIGKIDGLIIGYFNRVWILHINV